MEHGLKGMLLSVIGLLAANLLSHVIKGIWAFARRNIGPTKDQFKELTTALQENKSALDSQKLTMEKMALDIRRIYIYLKVISGARWPKYRKQVEEIEKEQNVN